MALLDKILGKDEREENLKKEIKSLEFRKQSVITSINGEIANLQSGQRKILFKAGEYAYNVWCKDNIQADLTSYWDQVQELANKIEEQETKKKEMTDRYEEEIKLIASNLHTEMHVAAPPVASSSAACPKCGSAIATDDIFCQSCGTKLQ